MLHMLYVGRNNGASFTLKVYLFTTVQNFGISEINTFMFTCSSLCYRDFNKTMIVGER